MGIKKEDLYHLIDQLQEHDQQKAYDYLRNLIKNPSTEDLKAYWNIIETYVEPDEEPLSETDQQKLGKQEFISWEQLKQGCWQK